MGIVENTYAELKQQELKNNPYSCLHMADIDINPHQVEAFTFALSSLELGGAILADEVGLGKTIEAGLVIKYLLCSGKNKILLIMPSNLRKQWQVELEEKFDIDSLIVDSSNWEDYLAKVKSKQAVIIVSYHFASKRKTEFGKIAWDFCVFDEAHRLRNVYKNGSKMANSLYELTKGIPKILLTATPMQNTLLDIYGLVQFIDDRVFYSKQIFSERYLRGEDYNDLKACLEPVVQRTLRKEVAEYIQFSERKEMTIDFELSPMEIELYVMINNYLKKEILYALPNSHRTLITSVIRKLLASSSMAVAETFKVLKGRLETLKETTRTESADESIDFFLSFFDDDEIETDDDSKQDELYTREKVNEFIQHEIDEVTAIINKAERIKRNAKMTALKQAVETAFAFQDEAGIKQRIVVFTESIRTQQYMFEELSHAGYEGQILKFNGSTNDPVTKQIYKAWKARNYGKYVGSRNVELKNAIVEAFRDEYKILLVTDSGSEGLNLQFCNTIINYDLPWNPQKIEQRIGRCHRYGQKNDVVVINLLNTQNVADKRVYEILSEKFELFQGVFGASDKAIGLLESGADFEKRVTVIDYCIKTDEKNGTSFFIEHLSRKSDFDIERLHRNLQTRFHIYSDKFVVHINDDEKYEINSNDIPEDKCQFVWKFPEDFEKDFDTETYKFKDLFEFGKVKGVQGKIYTSQTPLNKDVQGIVLFSRGKLVQEHSSFDDRANDNFFQYMSGSFDVDFIDNSFDVDNCSTDRKSLAWDIDENEELFKLQELIKKLVSIAQKKWREQRKAEKKRKVSSHGYDVDEWIKALNPAERPLAQKLTNAIIENDDIADDIAADYIGCIKDMYSFEGFKQFTAELDELQELDNEHAIKLLTDWNTIEAKEYAKIAIGRVKTIEQFEKFIQTNASERDVIQKFLEEFPWLLDAKMSKFEREITYTKLLKQKFNDESILPESNRRLDFLCTNSAGVIHVIELKRPRIKLTMKEIQQICEYVEFIETQFPQTQGNVKGFLISDNMTYEPGANKYRKGLEKEGIFIKSYSDLLAEARRYNDDLYKMYEDISMKKNNKSDK